MESTAIQPKAPDAEPGPKPDAKDDLKSPPKPEPQAKLEPSQDVISQADARKAVIPNGPTKVEEKKTNPFLKFLTYFLGSTPTKKRSVPRILLLVAMLIVCIAAATIGYRFLFVKAKAKYVTATIKRGDVESTVVAAGILQPHNYVDVGAQTSGLLKSLKVARGDRVEKGQLLAEIDPILAATALASAQAGHQDLTAQRKVKQALLTLAKLEKARNDKLLKAGEVSVEDRDITKSAYDAAMSTVNSLTAQILVTKAAVDAAQADLGYTNITAPIAGEVVSITTLEGQTINDKAQAPTILRIANLDTITVWAQVSEADIVSVKVGQDVYFTILGLNDRRWTGHVRQILPSPELINNVVFYDVLFDVPNSDRVLKIQMTAQVFIILAQAKNVLLIPVAAVGSASSNSAIMVRVLKPNGAVESRAIKIGVKSEIMAEVTEGLKEKEQIILSEIKPKGKTKNALSGQRAP
jgi:macrolide-specific efflux system membrane fusion protein